MRLPVPSNFCAGAALALLAATTPAANAAYPEKTIEVVVGWASGTGVDVATRVLAQAMSKRLGVTVQVINKPGGQSVVGTNEFIRAPADGYTLSSLSMVSVITQVLAGNAPYKSDDMTPIGVFTLLPQVIVTKGDAPYNNLKELGAFAKKASKPIVVGNYGPVAVPTQALVRVAAQDGWKPKLVTFQSVTYSQLSSGDADVLVTGVPEVAAQLKGGQVKALAAITPRRISSAPNTPTLEEAGHGPNILIWTALFAPKGTPPEIVAKLAAVLKDSLDDQAVKDFMTQTGGIIHYLGPTQTAEQIASDVQWLRKTMAESGMLKQ